MPFKQTQSGLTKSLFISLLAVGSLVVTVGVMRGYSFLPNRAQDGFASQLDFIERLLSTGLWREIIVSPLLIVHFFRYAAVWPFLAAEDYFGPAGPLSLLLLALSPLIIAFRPQRGDWRDLAYLSVRFAALLLPLLLSGRTVLVIIGMGYLVCGIMMRPFSSKRILLGAFLAVLSSASVLFSLAVLLIAGNGNDRSRAFYTTKLVVMVLVVSIFVPSLLTKAEGFTVGSPGYAAENMSGQIGQQATNEDNFGSGPAAAIARILARSTVAESFEQGNYVRLLTYVILLCSAVVYVLWCLLTGRRHPLNTVLCILSLGIFLEGLALWPILFPILWAYTGVVYSKRPQFQETPISRL